MLKLTYVVTELSSMFVEEGNPSHYLEYFICKYHKARFTDYGTKNYGTI
jgi:hypothetical protein